MSKETSFLLSKSPASDKLSLKFAIICIVDVFGVFPVIALPKAVIDCGFYGALVVLTVCSTQIYTATLLGRSWLIAEEIEPRIQRKNRYPYSALTEITLGSGFANFVSFLLDVTIFSGGVPNLIVASQNLQLLGLRLSDNTFDLSFCYWIVVIGLILCPVLWLGSPKDMKILCSISVSIVIFVFLLVVGCLILSTPSIDASLPVSEEPSTVKPFWQVIFTAYGIISFQYDIHPSILTIQVDMQQKNQLTKAILIGFGVSLSMFLVTILTVAIKFGSNIEPSILETLPTSSFLHFAAFFVAVQLCLSSAVSNSALYQHIEDCMSISRVFNHRRCILRTLLTILAILIAESVPRFDLVMSLIGGTLTAPLVFILPPIIYLKMLAKRNNYEKQLSMESFGNILDPAEVSTSKNVSEFMANEFRKEFDDDVQLSRKWQRVEKGVCVCIVGISLICTVATTYVNVTSAIGSVHFSQACIYNISKALMEL